MTLNVRFKYNFSATEIEAASKSAAIWHEFVRRREFEMLMNALGISRFRDALELGAGDGGQSVTISRYCDRLICTELCESDAERNAHFRARIGPNVQYVVHDAQDLSAFADNSFDLVFSSNMLEHVADPLRCLKECRRVLRPEGVMIHTMPTRTWKLFNFALHLVRYWSLPGVHGVSETHWQEFGAFGSHHWRSHFKASGLLLVAAIRLPFYVGHSNSFLPIIKAGNRLKWSATVGYVLRK